MADRKNNKLEVKLQLMKNEELGKLSLFATSFKDSVNSLDKAMNSYAQRIENIVLGAERSHGGLSGFVTSATGMVGAPISTGYNTGGYTHINVAQAGANARAAGTTSIDGDKPAIGQESAKRSKDSSLNDEVFLASMMNNPARAFTAQLPLGWALGKLAAGGGPDSRRNRLAASEATGWRGVPGGIMRQLQDNSQGVVAGAMASASAWGGYNAAAAGYRGYSQQAGLDTGAQTWGGWGAAPILNLWSEGGRQALKAKWSDKIAAISPAWSTEQAQQLRGQLTRMGRLEDQNGQLKNIMQLGFSGETAGMFQENLIRNNPNGLKYLTEDMVRLRDAAKAAGMSVEEFGQQAAAATSSLMQTGMTQHAAMKWTEYGAGLGMKPEQIAKIGSDPDMIARAAAMTPGLKGDLFARRYQVSNNPGMMVAEQKRLASVVFGPDIKDYGKLRKRLEKNPNDLDAQSRIGRMNMLAQSNPELTNGMQLGEWYDSMFDKDNLSAANSLAKLSDIQTYGDRDNLFSSSSRMRKMLKGAHASKKDINKYIKDVEDGHYDSTAKKAEAMRQILTKNSGKQDSNKQLIELTSDARKLLKLVGDDDKSHSNKFEKFAGYAIETAMPGGPLTGKAIEAGLKLL